VSCRPPELPRQFRELVAFGLAQIRSFVLPEDRRRILVELALAGDRVFENAL
jgi:hypothetical protein